MYDDNPAMYDNAAPLPAPTPLVDYPMPGAELDEHAAVVDAPASPPKRPAAKRTAPRRSEQAMLRRAAQLALDINAMEYADRDLLAGVLGLSAQTSTADIAATAARSTVKDWRAGTDTLDLLNSEPMEAAVKATALGRPRLTAVWRLFTIFGIVSGEMPASDAKAALTLAPAIGPDTVELRLAIEQSLERLAR